MENYILIPSWAIKLKKLKFNIDDKHFELKVTALMRMFIGLVVGLSNERGYCYASNAYICEALDCSTRQVQQMIKRLGYAGLLDVMDEESGRQMNINADGVDSLMTPAKNSQDREIIAPPPAKNSPNNKFNNKDIIINNTKGREPKHDFSFISKQEVLDCGDPKNLAKLLPDDRRAMIRAKYDDDQVALKKAYELLAGAILGNETLTKIPMLKIYAWMTSWIYDKAMGQLEAYSKAETAARKAQHYASKDNSKSGARR